MGKAPIKITVTGSAGQIAYSLLFRLAYGDLIGEGQPLIIYLQDISGTEAKLEGIVMELTDCDFPLLERVDFGSRLDDAFESTDIALLIGSKPRTAGMLRKDLLGENGKIFVEQGKALNRVAKRDVKVFVVGNPCNTNCLVAMHHAPDLPRKNFHAMMRLDHNRAKALLAQKADVESSLVKGMVVWGNHSATQVPDFTQVTIDGVEAIKKIPDLEWHQKEFLEVVQNRGAMVIEKLGRSSAASAANAALDDIRSLYTATERGEWFSSAVCSDENPYGVEKGLIFGFPCASKGDGSYAIVPGLKWDEFICQKIALSEKELMEERAFCKSKGLI
ncbi:MAG: malate dehydrogenase [Chlamydiales bacterium]